MSHISSLSAHGMQKLARNPVIIATFMALSLAGCASKKGLPNNANELGLGANGVNGANAKPGSSQDFTVNVGDRIFFDTDSTQIRATPSRRLTVRLSGLPSTELQDHGRRPCRRARHPRIQPGTWRPPCQCNARLSRLARRSGCAHEDDLLRQGTSGRHLRRHFLLVAEPSRRHRSRWRRHVISRSTDRVVLKGGLRVALFAWRVFLP